MGRFANLFLISITHDKLMDIIPVIIMPDKITIIKTFDGGVQFNRRESIVLEELVALDEVLILQVIDGSILVHQRTNTDFVEVGEPDPSFVLDPDYFLDSVAGDNSNDGLTESTPWETMGKFNSGSYVPGDVIVFKRNGNWTDETMVPPDSGEVGNPIIIADYGTGAKPVINRSNSGNGITISSSRSFITINNFDIQNGNGYGVYCQGSNILFNDVDSNSARIDNCRFDDGADNCIIDGGTWKNADEGHGISFKRDAGGARDCTIRNATITGNTEDGIQWQGGDNNDAINCTFSGNLENALDFKNGDGTLVSGCTCLSSGQDVVVFQSSMTNVTFEDNLFHKTTDGRVLLVQGLLSGSTFTLTSRRNRYVGAQSGGDGASLKLHNNDVGGDMVFNSSADIFDDDNRSNGNDGSSYLVRLRNAMTATFENCTFIKKNVNGGCITAASGSAISVKNCSLSTGNRECINMGSGTDNGIDNNHYDRPDNGEVYDVKGTSKTESNVTDVDAAAQTGAADFGSTTESNSDYLRPNSGSPLRSNGDDGFGPTNDNNDEAYAGSNRNIGAVKGQA